MINLYNTPASKKQEFTPIDGKNVRMYTCGPTVYDKPHIGNWSAYIYWDVLVRMLLANDYKVDRVLNITDVGHLTSDADEGEDKLAAGAKREGKTAWQIAEMYTTDFLQGMEYLGMVMPEHIARATDYLPEQLNLIKTLKQKGYTYQTSDGIYFDTDKFPRYADFAKLHLDDQEEGARVSVNSEKRNPSDFALWKFSTPEMKREMEWETPDEILDGPRNSSNSNGFPGWHLECSAIAMSILGPTLDIHTGGVDHIQIHHTNEIAQSEAATGQTFSHYWLHCNHLKVDGGKISKSLKNGYTLDDLREKGYDANDIRVFVLQSNYKNEGNFTFENLDAAENRVSHWLTAAVLRHQVHTSRKNSNTSIDLSVYVQEIVRALDDDLDTVRALMAVDDGVNKLLSTKLEDIPYHSLVDFLESIKDLLGIDLMSSTPDISDSDKQLVLARRVARSNKNWAESDRLRDQLLEKNIVVRDTNDDSIWNYAN